MTTIDITKLSATDLEKLQEQIKEKEKEERLKKQQDKELLKKLENDIVLSEAPYFIDKRDDVEARLLNLFKNIEPAIELRAELYGNKKREQDTHTFTLDDGTASIKVGWNVKPTFNGTESEGIVKIREFMTSLAGDSDNERLLMEFLELALKTDDQGNYDPKKVRASNKMRDRANSELFNEGMDIINEALIDIRTSRFARGYQMVDFGDGNIRRINFKFSID